MPFKLKETFKKQGAFSLLTFCWLDTDSNKALGDEQPQD